jgi:hypothetical protein
MAASRSGEPVTGGTRGANARGAAMGGRRGRHGGITAADVVGRSRMSRNKSRSLTNAQAFGKAERDGRV